ncbi:hypothetical protein A3D62_00455 [Candidatus Kaiserbacteria bacterium RIFCSPHIGHO2_02_FULL_49_11]|uniref:Phospholipid/glycerol acyltransferase domain-containing protein n=1 Tax=Candidatus Kaiserbacteria bacterium RIFCSPHIGHO2_02_FULL_49_11 TaxID=1798489 RepID=A0A1F6CYY7_9BACT|nr:MAG: hypothetical protein A3D62_00455 [Candidatus Kaiserbacteria bacterium RIFCSPHIGHO2_02_FULL_49_11]
MHIYRFPPIILQACIYLVTRVIFTVFGRLEIHGREHLEELPARIIFAANHSSEWDGPLIRSVLPFFSRFSPMYYVARPMGFYTGTGWRQYLYGGFIFKLLGAYPAYSGKKDYAFSLQNHIAIINEGRTLCIFPEGKVRLEKGFGEGHGGVAFLSSYCDATVIPVAIAGIKKLSFADVILRRRNVTVRFGTPISSKEIVPQTRPTIEDYKAGAALVMERIGKLLYEPSVAVTEFQYVRS